jgi:hypothetical protein
MVSHDIGFTGDALSAPRSPSTNLNDLKSQGSLGEDSRRKFKRDVSNVDGLADRTTSA